jgi:hypothetical protein
LELPRNQIVYIKDAKIGETHASDIRARLNGEMERRQGNAVIGLDCE